MDWPGDTSPNSLPELCGSVIGEHAATEAMSDTVKTVAGLTMGHFSEHWAPHPPPFSHYAECDPRSQWRARKGLTASMIILSGLFAPGLPLMALMCGIRSRLADLARGFLTCAAS